MAEHRGSQPPGCAPVPGRATPHPSHAWLPAAASWDQASQQGHVCPARWAGLVALEEHNGPIDSGLSMAVFTRDTCQALGPPSPQPAPRSPGSCPPGASRHGRCGPDTWNARCQGLSIWPLPTLGMTLSRAQHLPWRLCQCLGHEWPQLEPFRNRELTPAQDTPLPGRQLGAWVGPQVLEEGDHCAGR